VELIALCSMCGRASELPDNYALGRCEHCDGLLGPEPMYLDRCGNEITMGRWMDLRGGDDSYKRIALTVVGSWHVSTVWTGHNLSVGFGPPLVFETMVFENAESNSAGGLFPSFVYHESRDWFTSRYSTEQQARDGHEATVREVRDLFLPVRADLWHR
jgi:hypothetical protein